MNNGKQHDYHELERPPFFIIKEDSPKAKFYLQENLEKLIISPQFFRKFTDILHSKDYQTEQQKQFLLKLKEHFFDQESSNEEEKYISDNNFIIEWLTISGTTVFLDYVNLLCKIQLTAKSVLSSSYSSFQAQDLEKTESAIEIFANSKAIFNHCHFTKAQRVSVIVRNFSSVRFENCTFDDNKISCFIMDDSFAEFYQCKFRNDRNISVFATKNSKCQMFDCEFNSIQGKALFAKDSSKIYLKDTKFINCEKGAATIAENSSIFFDDGVIIENPNNTSIRAINNSHVKAKNVKISGTNGNAINIENSDGYFYNCEIINTEHPTIAVIGRNANPVFYNCSMLSNKNTFCVICKSCCTPMFINCTFDKCETNCFSISDSARVHIENCRFYNIKKCIINAFGGSYVTYSNIYPGNQKLIIHHSNTATCEQKSIQKVQDENNNKNNENDDDDDNDLCCHEHVHIRSWRSPTYEIPPDITKMKDPEEFVNNEMILPLKIQNMSKIIKNAENKSCDFVCSACHKHMTKDDKPNVICPCGHLICDDCKDISKCPLCDSPVKEIHKIYIEDVCSICLEKKPNTISLPCGHFCMCYECASKSYEMNYNCPMCNEHLSSFKYVFDDVDGADIVLEDKEEVFAIDQRKLRSVKSCDCLYDSIKTAIDESKLLI